MPTVQPVDLDYLTARLHGRRSRLAEAERLDSLCRLRSIADLVRAISPDSHIESVTELQRSLILQAVEELGQFARQLPARASEFMSWLQSRYQLENLKLLARGFATGRSLEMVRPLLVDLPDNLALDIEALGTAASVVEFANAAPPGVFQRALTDAAGPFERLHRPIILESALDRAYFGELLQRARALPGDGRSYAISLVKQEIDTFHLMLVIRGRFTYSIDAAHLENFHLPGARISRRRYEAMLSAAGPASAARMDVDRAISELPSRDEGHFDPAAVEMLAWNRYHQLATRAFRRSHMGLGAVVAFAAMRRIELANLITLSEGIRAELEPGVIRRRLIPADTETAHV